MELENLVSVSAEAVHKQTVLPYFLLAASLLMLDVDASGRAHKLQLTMHHSTPQPTSMRLKSVELLLS